MAETVVTTRSSSSPVWRTPSPGRLRIEVSSTEQNEGWAMKLWWLLVVLVAGLGSPRILVAADVIPTPAGGVVLTDPMVRSIQIGPPPVGALTALNPATGIGMVAVPGIGLRPARLVGIPQAWAGGRAVQAIDLATDVEFTA